MYARKHFGIYPRRSLSGIEYIYVSGNAIDVCPAFLSARLYACVRMRPCTRYACVRPRGFACACVLECACACVCARLGISLCACARVLCACVCSVSVVVCLYLCLGRVCAHVHMVLHFLQFRSARARVVKVCSVCVPRGRQGGPSRGTGGIYDGRVCVVRSCHRSVARWPQERRGRAARPARNGLPDLGTRP
jgi:hypothetical protein